MSSSPSKPQSEPDKQKRQRTLVGILVLVLTLTGLLAWFLFHPSSSSSPARKVKNFVFGPRFAEAAEQFVTHNGEPGLNPGAGQGTSGGAGNGAGAGAGSGGGAQGKGNTQGGSHGEGGPANGEGGGAGGDAGGMGEGHGTPLTGPVSGPANPHAPTNNPAELPAPSARSIGWLDRFFGTQQPSENTPLRPGEGGTASHKPGAGNTNATPNRAETNAVAAEFTESNPPAPAGVTLEEPPAPARSTNRAPPSASTLNDNFEQLLRQNRAGSGDVRISLMWTNQNDLDLHVVDPNGEEIFYCHRLARSGGLLDIDMNASPPLRVPAVENVFWPQRAAPLGQYHIYVNHYRRHDSADLTTFTVRVLIRGRTSDITGNIRFGEPKKHIYQFLLQAGG